MWLSVMSCPCAMGMTLWQGRHTVVQAPHRGTGTMPWHGHHCIARHRTVSRVPHRMCRVHNTVECLSAWTMALLNMKLLKSKRIVCEKAKPQ